MQRRNLADGTRKTTGCAATSPALRSEATLVFVAASQLESDLCAGAP